MSTVERIEAAIEKLTELRDKSTPGPWVGWRKYDPLRGEVYGIEACEIDIITVRSYNRADAELIEVLHTTIDAVLDLLRTARGFYGAKITGPEVATLFAEHALALADTILVGGFSRTPQPSTDPRDVAHIECDCVPDIGPSHCHLCSERAGHPVSWIEAHPAQPGTVTNEGDVKAWIEKTLALPMYQNAISEYGQGVVETLRNVRKLLDGEAAL